ncbi:hypothetical protein PENTCL1PPCAC_27797, partial [Pristionchus entomophagus]
FQSFSSPHSSSLLVTTSSSPSSSTIQMGELESTAVLSQVTPPIQSTSAPTLFLTIMTQADMFETVPQFTSSSRSGRRNAVAEIDVESIDPTGEKLASRFAQLGSEEGQSTSAQSDDGQSTSQG